MSSFVEFPLVLTPVLERGSVESSVAYQRSAKKSIFAGGGRSSVTLTRKLESTQSGRIFFNVVRFGSLADMLGCLKKRPHYL